VLETRQAETAFEEAVESELQTVEKETYDLLERMRTISDQLDRLAVRAPVSGIIVNRAVHTVGGVVAPGGHILDIVPENDRLVIDAQVHPSDIEDVRANQRAEIRFPSLSQLDLPRLFGQVVTVSADRLVDAASGAAYYKARVSVDDATLANLDGVELKPGMPAEVIIIKAERTLLEYLMSPLKHAMARALRE
jgi:HlyD family type I secretion membrane fusion protein